MNRMYALLFVLAALGLALGCFDSGRVQEEQIKVAPLDPFAQIKQTLEGYVKGQPMASEASMFPAIIESAKKVDPAKGAILEAGLNDLQKASPQARPAKAKELLDKLQSK